MYLTAVIDIGNLNYLPCKQYIKNPRKFTQKFTRKAKPGLYTLNFDKQSYVCLITENTKYIYDSISQNFTTQVDTPKLIYDLSYTINNSKFKKKLLYLILVLLYKSLKFTDEQIDKLFIVSNKVDANEKLKNELLNKIYNNDKEFYTVIVGGKASVKTSKSKPDKKDKSDKPEQVEQSSENNQSDDESNPCNKKEPVTKFSVLKDIARSFAEGLPIIGYPFIAYDVLSRYCDGSLFSFSFMNIFRNMLIPLKFIPGLGFIINLFKIFGKIITLIKLFSS